MARQIAGMSVRDHAGCGLNPTVPEADTIAFSGMLSIVKISGSLVTGTTVLCSALMV